MPGARLPRALACLLALASGWAAAQAADPALEASRDYLVGASISSSRPHLGTEDQRIGAGAMWAFQLGRFRFATSGASALLSQGRQRVDSGVSTELRATTHTTLSASLSFEEGRDWDKDPVYRGLPDVRSTLRGRLTASTSLTSRLSASLRASQDLLGRDGGLRLDGGLSYRYPISDQTHWDLSLGLGWANGTYNRTHYGIDAASAAATGLPFHTLGSGIDSASIGWRLTSALSRRWVGFAGVSVSQLQGDAARSPLVTSRTVYGASVGLAYRSD